MFNRYFQIRDIDHKYPIQSAKNLHGAKYVRII